MIHKDLINSLRKNDKVSIVYGEDSEIFEGFISSISEDHLTIHEYVSDTYRTFLVEFIVEIQKI